jgi:hypothetical protein
VAGAELVVGGSLAGQLIPARGPQDPLKARWMGIDGGAGHPRDGYTSGYGSDRHRRLARLHAHGRFPT